MAFDAPDWQGFTWKTEVTPRPNLLFPTGKVIIAEEFASPNAAGRNSLGTDGTITIQTDQFFTPPAAGKFVTATVADDETTRNFTFGFPQSKKVGIEFAFSRKAASNPEMLAGFSLVSAGKVYTGKVKFRMATNRWQLYNTAGSYEDITGGVQVLESQEWYFHRAKLTVDFNTNTYGKLNCNDLELDLSSNALHETASPYNGHITAFVGVVSTGFATHIGRIDNITITEE